jgi:hypothetical protein
MGAVNARFPLLALVQPRRHLTTGFQRLDPASAHPAHPQRRIVPPEVEVWRVEISAGELLQARLGDGMLLQQRMPAKVRNVRRIEQQL